MPNSITIAGTITVDELNFIQSYPKESQLTTVHKIDRSLGGLVANCALALTRINQNIPLKAIAVIGNDEKGDYIMQQLGKYKNINLDHVVRAGDTPFTLVMESMKERTRTFFNYKGNSTMFDERTIDFSELETKHLHIGYLLLLDALDAEDPIYGTKMAALLKKAKEQGIETSIDVITEDSDRYKRIIPPALAYTDYCIINELEAGKILNLNMRDESNHIKADNVKLALKKLKEMGVNRWVIIHAPEGGFGYDGLTYYSVPSISLTNEQIHATVGAGDAFASGILYGIYQGLSIYQALTLAIATATSSLLSPNSILGIKSYEELIPFYEQSPKNKYIQL